MPIDETLIDTKITELRDAEIKADEKSSEIRQIKLRLMSIKKETITNLDGTTEISDPMDKDLGGKMSATRRQSIYTKALADATTLGL